MIEAESQGLAKPMRIVVVVLIVLVAAWFFLRSYTSSASRECVRQYRLARTAADTARVDSTVVSHSDPRPCVVMRMAARWQ
jgi:ABC-type nickel/cobalt efflux system permease component RcnA